MELTAAPLGPLCRAADQIRAAFCGNRFDFCSIVNGKSGKCAEDCKFCAQSACYWGNPAVYPLKSADELAEEAAHNARRGVGRFSVVTSGRRLTDGEVESLCESFRAIRRRTSILFCASCGLLTPGQFAALRAAGVGRYHNNLETSRRYFPAVCTTHTYDQKRDVLRMAREAGMELCSGGIIGMGETWEDRVDLALDLRELDVASVPLNVLNPIPGTPFGNLPVLEEEEGCRTAALFRFLLPAAAIRLAGGRGLSATKGAGAFRSGANAAITGDMLTTAGVGIADDLRLVRGLGYEVGL